MTMSTTGGITFLFYNIHYMHWNKTVLYGWTGENSIFPQTPGERKKLNNLLHDKCVFMRFQSHFSVHFSIQSCGPEPTCWSGCHWLRSISGKTEGRNLTPAPAIELLRLTHRREPRQHHTVTLDPHKQLFRKESSTHTGWLSFSVFLKMLLE